MEIHFNLTFDPPLQDSEVHVHRILRCYKRAVLNEADKTWSSSTTILKHEYQFTLIPKEGFFDSAALCDDPYLRYEQLKLVVYQNFENYLPDRINFLTRRIEICLLKSDIVRLHDCLDDLEDFLYEDDEEKRIHDNACRNKFINQFSFINLYRGHEDSETIDCIKDLNYSASFIFSHFIKHREKLESAVEAAVNVLNGTSFKSLQDKMDGVANVVDRSFTRKCLTAKLKDLPLTPEQKEAVKVNFNSPELELSNIVSADKQVEIFLGINSFSQEKVRKVYFHKQHWDTFITRVEKILDFAKTSSEKLTDDMEELTGLLTYELPDNIRMDELANDIFKEVVDLTNECAIDYFTGCTETSNQNQRKIKNIKNSLLCGNVLQAYGKIIDL